MADRRLSAPELRDVLVDGWESWDRPAGDLGADDVGASGVESAYVTELRKARDRTGVDESVITGVGDVGGVRIALVISEFGFLGGSIGATAGSRIVEAVGRATREGLPVLALPASGGTRMQEGTAAFLQMLAISGAVLRHRASGLPYLVYLRHPTTGGVFASWGSLGQVTWAEPGALIGFLGPRVHLALVGDDLPGDVQTAENLARVGLVDAVVPVHDLARRVAAAVSMLSAPVQGVEGQALRGQAGLPSTDAGWHDPRSTTARTLSRAVPDDCPPRPDPAQVWASVTATRSDDRPGLTDLLAATTGITTTTDPTTTNTPTVPIRDDGPIRLALHRFGGRTALVIGQDRRTQREGWRIGPAELRVARRGIQLAGELGLPVVTVIDTPGAELSAAAEEGGLAGEIAQCTADIVSAPTPTVSVLLGEGAGGAALALFGTDRRIAATDSWLSPLPPEGASVIVHQDTDHAADVAGRQGISAADLYHTGMVDLLVPADPGEVHAAVTAMLDDVAAPSPDDRCRVPGPAPTRIPAVGAVVRDTTGRFLLVQRGHEPQAGLWTVPGGKVERGETFRAAVAREVLEETGIEIDVGDAAWVVDIPTGTGSGAVYEVHDFVGTPRTTEAAGAVTVTAGDDAADAGWFTPQEMVALPMTPGLLEHLERAGLL
ncbi:hypothetical protein GCM10009624_18720 [Gordonia sinesedis]